MYLSQVLPVVTLYSDFSLYFSLDLVCFSKFLLSYRVIVLCDVLLLQT